MSGKRETQLMVATGFVVLALAVALPASDDLTAQKGAAPTTAAGSRTIAAGTVAKVEGVVVATDPAAFKMKDTGGLEVSVVVVPQTRFKEKKSNPFRGAERYSTDQLVRGLAVEVKGRGDTAGALVAEEVRFTQDDLRFANSLQSRVAPVEVRVADTEGRLKQSEEKAQHMAGQIDELATISNAARGGAKAAQESADAAQRTADMANSGVKGVHDRISLLDDFDVRDTGTLRFKAGSATLTTEAQVELDRLAAKSKNVPGYMIEVTGYASADGNEARNRQLSERRANTVVRYLVEQQEVPLRRIITPFGFGSKHPVADNATRDGRLQNRRVDVRILVNKAVGQKDAATAEVRTHTN